MSVADLRFTGPRAKGYVESARMMDSNLNRNIHDKEEFEVNKTCTDLTHNMEELSKVIYEPVAFNFLNYDEERKYFLSRSKFLPIGVLTIHKPVERLKSLIAYGEVISMNKQVPAWMYFTATKVMLDSANFYYEAKQYEVAFVMYLKYLTLFMVKLRTHPGYHKVPVRERAINRNTIAEVVCPRIEKLRIVLYNKFVKRYKDYVDGLPRRLKMDNCARKVRDYHVKHEELYGKMKQEVDKLYVVEVRKSVGTHQKAELKPYISLPNYKPPPVPGSLCSTSKEGISNASSSSYSSTPPFSRRRTSTMPTAVVVPCQVTVKQPSTSKSKVSIGGELSRRTTESTSTETSSTHPKSRVIPRGGRFISPTETTKKYYTTPSIDYLLTLRIIAMPQVVVSSFEFVAEENTRNKTQTLGIIAGHRGRIEEELVATHLLIPEQSGTLDMATILDAGAVFRYQEQHDLITLGWIITHPTEIPFLSSRDLHTHYAYQLLIAEAVAVVVAPNHMRYAIYTLSSTHGFKTIGNCTETGFHPHPIHPNLYKLAQHVRLNTYETIELVDLRQSHPKQFKPTRSQCCKNEYYCRKFDRDNHID